MMSFRAGDIVVVDYPHVETAHFTRRPALIISDKPIGPDGLVIWVLMITSSVNRGWPGDLVIEDYSGAGLPIPSVIRTEKIATLEAQGAEPIGRIDDALLATVRKHMTFYLEGTPS
jgi:mRNA interferase MazF